MKTVEQSLITDQEKAVATAEHLKKQKNEMQTLVSKREKLYRQTRSDYDIQAEAIARMASEAETLQQLVSRIDALACEQESRPKEKTQKTSVKIPSLPGGAWQQLVSGNVSLHFGEKDDIGATSQGIRISTRPGALVVAPAGGVVRFVGPFRNYGNMVIIEHDKDFHSLISGLSRIDLTVGRKISAGEPVGSLPGSGAEDPSRLYYELRHKGKPVDPAAKFPGLS
jgi:septal ring factor EnvC (AmiA/AmiB activator)